MDDKDNKMSENEKKPVNVGWKDILAAIIAEFEILMPIVIIACVIFALLIFLIDRFWLR